MIQFRRGTTKSWKNTKIKLASGQPGYDKDKHKIKIGDGETSWDKLPYVGGLSAQEIIDSEVNAKARNKQDKEDKTLITYGTDLPNEQTIGTLYLHQSTSDYIIESGIADGWAYQIYGSGIMKCYGTFKVTLDIIDSIEGTGLYCDSSNFKKNYPKTFKNPPSETASVQNSNGFAWLANKGINTVTSSGTYSIVSLTSANNIECTISIQAIGIKQ